MRSVGFLAMGRVGVHFCEDAGGTRVLDGLGLGLELEAVGLAEAEFLGVLGLKVVWFDRDRAIPGLCLLDEVADYVFWVHADGFEDLFGLLLL